MNETFRIIQSRSEFQQLEDIWDDLLKKSPADNYFLTWDWVWTWWQAYAQKEDTLAIGILEYQNTITGIVPCYIRREHFVGPFSLRKLFFLGTQQSGGGEVCPDYMDFIYHSGEEHLIVEKFISAIIQNKLCDELCFSRMDCTSPTFQYLQEIAKRYNILALADDVFASPFIRLPSSWNGYLDSLSPSMRYKIRREQRKLEKSKDITFTQPANEKEALLLFEDLIALHQKRWNSRNKGGSFANQQFTSFHKKMIPLMFKNNHLDLTVLSENKELKAALYNIRYKNKIYFYQSGILSGPGLPAYGYLIHRYCIENAIQNNLTEYDFLPKGGNDGYKDHFANSKRNVSHVTMYIGTLLKMCIRLKVSLRPFYHKVKTFKINTTGNTII